MEYFPLLMASQRFKSMALHLFGLESSLTRVHKTLDAHSTASTRGMCLSCFQLFSRVQSSAFIGPFLLRVGVTQTKPPIGQCLAPWNVT